MNTDARDLATRLVIALQQDPKWSALLGALRQLTNVDPAREPTFDDWLTAVETDGDWKDWEEAARSAFEFARGNTRTLPAESSAQPPLFDGERNADVEVIFRGLLTCRRCGGAMRSGKAMVSTWTGGMPDFPGDRDNVVTMSPGGPGRLIDCLKCEGCGRSVTV